MKDFQENISRQGRGDVQPMLEEGFAAGELAKGAGRSLGKSWLLLHRERFQII